MAQMQIAQNPTDQNMTVLQILDRAFRIYRENFLQFVGLTAIVTVPLTLITLLLDQSYLGQLQNFDFTASQTSSFTTGYSNAILLPALISIVLTILQAVFVSGTITYTTSENHLGRRITVSDSLRAAQGRFATLFGALVLFYLLVFLLAVVSGITLICLVGIAGFAFLIYFGITTSTFLVPTIMLENVGGTLGMLRAWGLGKARFWSVLGLLILISVLSFILTFAFTLLEQLVTGQVIASASLQSSAVISSIINMIIGIFVAPIAPIAYTLMYYDTRVRLEALDIALQATGNPDARPWDVPSPPASARVTGKDIVNILILVGVAAIIVLGLGASMGAILNTFFPNIPIQ
ncbi:MAG: hypothetical protein WB812_03830 [Woeseiaceae bacterium]